MIVRISGEVRFKLPDEDEERLNELDNRAVSAVEQGDEAGFRELWVQVSELVSKRAATPSPTRGLVESDIHPAAARHHAARRRQGEFAGEGLIPD